MFQLELKDRAEAEAIISQNLTCSQRGIIFKGEEFRAPIWVRQCHNYQNFGHSVKNCQAKTKCVICREGHSHKGRPNTEKSRQNVPTVENHKMLTIRVSCL